MGAWLLAKNVHSVRLWARREMLSRNHSAGVRLAHGETLIDLKMSSLNAEGVPTVKAVHEYAAEHGLVLPICQEVYRVVFEQKAPHTALADLMRRDTKPEG